MCSNATQVHFFSKHLLVTFGYQNINKHSKKLLMLQQSSLLFDSPLLLLAPLFSAQANAATVTMTLW